jgi:uncharacterized protein (UPF0303 family)
MGKNSAQIEKIQKQEEELVFESFNSSDAFKIGEMLIEKAKANNVAYAINVSLNRRQLFHFSMDGAAPDNDKWIARKENTVYNFYESSYRVTLEFEDKSWSLYPQFGLNEENYAASGGSFPLNVKGVGVVGAITVSGLPQEVDHQYVVEVLKEYLNK